MKLIIHTMYYPPEMGAPQARLSDLARGLKLRGHEVEVITAMPNYPTGKIFTGYPRWYLKEELQGIPVHRCFLVPSNRPNMIPRLISYLSFCCSSWIVGTIKIGKADFIMTESPPLFLGLIGWLLSWQKRARWILNVSDLWPDSAKYIGMLQENSRIYRLLKSLAQFLYRQANLLTGQSREIVSELKAQSPTAFTYHLSNGVRPEIFHPGCRSADIRRRYLQEGEVGFVYAGLHGLFQGLDQIIDAAGELRKEAIRFIFFGDGPEKDALIKRAQDLRLTKVVFYPPVPHDQIPAILASMDVAVISLKTRIQGAVPSKIYEAMGCGVPILLVGGGEARDILESEQAGMVVAPNDLVGLVQAVQGLASNPSRRKKLGQAGRKAAERTYNRTEIIKRFDLELLKMQEGMSDCESQTNSAAYYSEETGRTSP
jgi:colanic acid biosynthesis glycosyl transferase WcaI